MKKGVAALLVIGIVVILGVIIGMVFGPEDISRLGRLSMRQQAQRSQAQTISQPACSDGFDNDSDAQIDASDSGCFAPSDASEAEDNDSDGFVDKLEKSVGTDVEDNCSDDQGNPAWPPDINNDRLVNRVDTGLFRAHLGSKAGSENFDARFDLNGDGQITSADLSIVNSHLNQKCE